MSRLCPNCRAELRTRSKFCPNCGTTALSGAEAVATAEAGDAEAVADVRPTRESSRITAKHARSFAPATHSLVGPHEQAGFGLRFGALLFDLLIMMILWMAATFALSALSNKSIVSSNSMLAAVYAVAVLLYVLNFVFLAGRTGQSLGKRIIGIRIVRVDGGPLDVRGAAYRHLVGYFLSAAGALLGFVWIVLDRKQQGWHDKLAHTYVVLIP
jgi:uncharacterized RDD family membrane protein YckC